MKLIGNMNRDLVLLQDRLIRVHGGLRSQLEKTQDASQRRALVIEMQEVTHRVQIITGLLLTDIGKGLEEKTKAVSAATKSLSQAIAQIQQLSSFLQTVANFLRLVDEVIDLAKSLAV